MSEYNEEAYRRARASTIQLPCPFERAVLSRCVGCGFARKLLLAEREAITCTDAPACERCQAFYKALHDNARFALRLSSDQPWPFGKEIRAQCGGLLELRAILDQAADAPDVASLVEEGIARYGAIGEFPYSRLMRGVAHYEPRRRHR